MPFNETWFYGDSIFIIDPWIWIALGGGVLLARRRDKVSHKHARRPARIALVSVIAYIVLMLGGSRVARQLTHDHVVAAEHETPLRIMAGPVPANPFVRELIVDLGDEYLVGRLRWTPSPVISLPDTLLVNATRPAVQAAIEQGAFRDFLYWSRFPLFTVQELGDSARVRVGDARFAGRGGISSSFSQSVVVPLAR